MLKEELSVLPVPETNEYVKEYPASGSEVFNVPTIVLEATFSSIVDADKRISVGASFTLFTSIKNISSKNNPP